MTTQEQSELAQQAQGGSQVAILHLLQFCERDIQAIARKADPNPSNQEDLAQIGRMAILESVIPNFNPKAGLQFRFYAALWVRTAIKRSSNLQSSVVPKNVRVRCQGDASLNEPSNDDESLAAIDMLVDERALGADERIEIEQRNRKIRAAFLKAGQALSKRNCPGYNRAALVQDLLQLRILSTTPIRLRELAQKYGILRQTVDHLETKIYNRAIKALSQEEL